MHGHVETCHNWRVRRPTTLPQLFSQIGDTIIAEADGDQVTSPAELAELTARVQAGLTALGLQAGDRIAVWLPNTVEYLAILWASARLGLVVVSINTRYRSTEVADIAGRSGARQLVVDPSFLGIDFAGILEELDKATVPSLEGIITINDAPRARLWPWPTTSFVGLTSYGNDTKDLSTPDSPSAVFTTSGTTRAPKLVMHTQRSQVDHALDLAPGFGPSVLVALPLCGVFGHTMLLAGMAASAKQVLLPIFDEHVAVRSIEQYGVKTFYASDDILDRVLAVEGDLSSLDPVGYARFNNALQDVAERAKARGIDAVGLYGMSEVHALFAYRKPEDGVSATLPGGTLISPSAEARVVDPQSGAVLDPGSDGELQLRGPSMFAGYLMTGGAGVDPELTTEHFQDGWFKTGDLARMQGKRSFEYLTRMGDVLRLGGFLVSPAEIEARLVSHPEIEAAQVVAIDLTTGAKAVAFVTLVDASEQDDPAGFDEEAIRQFCRQGLAGYKTPVRVVPIDAFPTVASANGTKIQKVKLRQMAAELSTT